MNSKEIFALALNLESPWYIKDVGLKKEENDPIGYLTIEIDFKKGAKFLMGDGERYTAYDTEIKRWQHLNFFEHKCYIVARVPRVKMRNSKVRMVQVPWARQGSGFTLLFEAYSMLLIEQEMPVNKVSRTIRVTAPRIWRIFDYWIKKAVAKDDVSEVEQIGIDETSSKKGHNYVTVTVDVDNKRVIHAGEGKDNTTIENMKKELQPKGLKPENIQNISIDMSPAFIQGIKENFADSQIVFDRFHIKKMLNEAFDQVRRKERKTNELLKNHKYTFLKNYENLSEKKQNELDMITFMYPKIGEAYRLKVLFDDFYEISNPQEAQGYLAFWCDLVEESKIYPLIEFTRTLKAHWSGIINYINAKITTGVIEGINNKIQLAKRRARGFRNIQNFINMIYFLCGKLNFDYPQYPL